MTLFPQAGEGAALAPTSDDRFRDVLRLFAAASDAAVGDPIGTTARVAAIAAAFLEQRGAQPDAVRSLYVAGLLHRTGYLGGRTERSIDPILAAVAIVRSLPALPPECADLVRWHAEHFDGTGEPDGLRWNAIPDEAATLGLARRFTEAAIAHEGDREEAAYALLARSGRDVAPELGDAFHHFVAALPGDAPIGAVPGPAFPATEADVAAALRVLASAIERRDGASDGTNDLLVSTAEDEARARGWDDAGVARAGVAARLWSLRSLAEWDDGPAALGAALLEASGSFGAYASAVGEDAGDPIAQLVSAASARLS